MATPLIDLETMYKVQRAAPKPATHSPTEARLLLRSLLAHATDHDPRIGMDDLPYHFVQLANLQPDLPQALSPKRAGMLCRALGLSMVRNKDGFEVLWTDNQMSVLCEYFNIDEGAHGHAD